MSNGISKYVLLIRNINFKITDRAPLICNKKNSVTIFLASHFFFTGLVLVIQVHADIRYFENRRHRQLSISNTVLSYPILNLSHRRLIDAKFEPVLNVS